VPVESTKARIYLFMIFQTFNTVICV